MAVRAVWGHRSRRGLPPSLPVLQAGLRPYEGTPSADRRRARQYLNGTDLYPDVRPCLKELRDAGYFVGIAGNQTQRAGHFIRELNLVADIVATSDDWGVATPSTAFFERLISVSGQDPAEIVYVGDRLDNDITPAAAAGLRTAWVRRGPWGYIVGQGSATPIGIVTVQPDWELSSLEGLSERLGRS